MVEESFTVLYVDDLARLTAFYRERLGLELAPRSPGWAEFRLGKTTFILQPRTEAGPAGPVHGSGRAAFQVSNLEAEYQDLKERGVEFVAPPAQAPFGKHAVFLDPEGNLVELVERNTPRPTAVTAESVVNEIVARHPETMEVLEAHGIRICGGCIVLLNSPVAQTADYSGLGSTEAADLVRELNDKVHALEPVSAVDEPART